MKTEELNETIQTEKKSIGIFWFGKQKVTSKRTFDLPIEIRNLKVSLKTEIVDGDVLWLVGTESLSKMGAIIDLEKEVVILSKLKNHHLELKMNDMGHATIPLRKNERGNLIWIERQSKL